LFVDFICTMFMNDYVPVHMIIIHIHIISYNACITLHIIFDCGELNTDNSIVEVTYDSTLNGAVAVYSCPVGYKQLSDDNRYSVCQNDGSWSLEQPACIQIGKYFLH